MSNFTDKLKSIFGLSEKPKLSAPKMTSGAEYGAPDSFTTYEDLMSHSKMTRQDLYDIYDSMDEMSDIASILDAYAEDATQSDFRKKTSLWVEGSDKKIVDELNQLTETLDICDWDLGLARDLGKMGDDFARLHATPGLGVTSLEWVDPRFIERIESRDGKLLGFESAATLKDYKRRLQNNKNAQPSFKPWDFVHWRIYKIKRLPHQSYRNIYGTSLLYSSDRIAKQVKILDDILMIIRLTKSLDRYIYHVDVGKSPVEEEVRILKKWRKALKRKQYVDPSSGRFDSRFDPISFTKDIFFPTKEGANSRVDTVQGLGNVSDIADVDRFNNKLFGSFRAPKSYFGYEGGADSDPKASLASQSVRWAKAVASLQKAMITGFVRLFRIHLAWKGMDPDPSKFSVCMVTPSVIELLDRLEAWQTIIDVAERMATLGETLDLDKFKWTKYILENVLWLSEQEVKEFLKDLEKAQEEPEPPQSTPLVPQNTQDDDSEDGEEDQDDTEKAQESVYIEELRKSVKNFCKAAVDDSDEDQ